MLNSSYRMFLRAFSRVRVILDSVVAYALHPPALLGGLWGGRSPAPVRGFQGDTPPGYSVYYGSPYWAILPPLKGGVWGGPHKSLLDLLVRTDTKGGSRGSKGDPTIPIVCEFCEMPIRVCQCRVGKDY